jgi:hypothetical protein
MMDILRRIWRWVAKDVHGLVEYTMGLSGWRRYRRLRGGHWERCYVKPVCGEMWFRQDHDEAAEMALRKYGPIEILLECEQW